MGTETRWFVVPTHWDTAEQVIPCEDRDHGVAVLAMYGRDQRATLCALEKRGGAWWEVACITRDGFNAISEGGGFDISAHYRQYLGLDNE
jgi:hypothetical protein